MASKKTNPEIAALTAAVQTLTEKVVISTASAHEAKKSADESNQALRELTVFLRGSEQFGGASAGGLSQKVDGLVTAVEKLAHGQKNLAVQMETQVQRTISHDNWLKAQADTIDKVRHLTPETIEALKKDIPLIAVDAVESHVRKAFWKGTITVFGSGGLAAGLIMWWINRKP